MAVAPESRGRLLVRLSSARMEAGLNGGLTTCPRKGLVITAKMPNVALSANRATPHFLAALPATQSLRVSVQVCSGAAHTHLGESRRPLPLAALSPGRRSSAGSIH